jgi:peptidoglycan/xylan/chitin deacetylase (PgdA/CDA1 family)
MRIQPIGTVQRGARWLRRWLDSRALILLYHRVGDVGSDPWRLCITPQHFAEHLEILRRRARPMRLEELVQALRNGHCPRHAAVVTFDDGYADNLYNARPLLERYTVPATVFVTTGQLGSKREFWWDELERVLLEPASLPETLRLDVNGHPHVWQLGSGAQQTEEATQRHRQWEAWSEEHPTPRHALYRSLYQLLYPVSDSARRPVLEALGAWAGTEPTARATHRALTPGELRTLAGGNLVDAGSHTVTHSVLSAFAPHVQWEELRHSKAALEEILSQPVTAFAYPYGKRCDYTAKTAALVEAAGFTSGCANFHGPVMGSTDTFHLPRMQIRDWDGDAFSRQLSSWLGR